MEINGHIDTPSGLILGKSVGKEDWVDPRAGLDAAEWRQISANRTYVYMNFFDHKDLGNHLPQLCPKVVKHPVYQIQRKFQHVISSVK
jgi:hypothetical protein